VVCAHAMPVEAANTAILNKAFMQFLNF